MLQHLSYQLVVCCIASIFLVESCTINLTSLFIVPSICMLGVCYSFYLASCKLYHLQACCMLQHHIQLVVCCSIYLARCMLQHLSCLLYVVASYIASCMLQHLSCQVHVVASILLVVCCSIIYSELYVVASIQLVVCCSIYLASCMLQHLSYQLYNILPFAGLMLQFAFFYY